MFYLAQSRAAKPKPFREMCDIDGLAEQEIETVRLKIFPYVNNQ